jgi:phage terminase large subunit
MQWKQKQPKTYYDLKGSRKRIVINQGGTRSGKTYSTLQVLCEYCQRNRDSGAIISVIRKTLPALKGSAYRDFLEILQREGWYSENDHNKSEMYYNLFGNLFEFISVDQPQKIRGRKRTICFINEANELTWEDFFQLNIRTSDKIIVDYNPSDEFHWIYEKLQIREDADFFVSTYLNNPYLPQELIDEIELLRQADDNYWRVYGLGERGISQETVYTHWSYGEFPEDCEVAYGVDFGYNVPSTVVKIGFKEASCYVSEALYETKLTTNDLIERLKGLGIDRSDELFCDNAEPKTIEELCRAGYNAKPAEKDVYAGIQKVKSMPLIVTPESANLIKEIKSYKWKLDKNGKIHPDEVPVKFNDHAMDAMRYGIYTKLNRPKFEIIV